MSKQRRMMMSGAPSAGGGSSSGEVYSYEGASSELPEEDTGLALLSGDYPNWTLFAYQDPDTENVWSSCWRLWVNDSSTSKECGMDLIHGTSSSDANWRGYGLRLRDKYVNFGRTINAWGTVNSVWSWNCFASAPFAVAVRRNSEGYSYSTDGVTWTTFIDTFTLTYMTLTIGPSSSPGKTEIRLWMDGEKDIKEYFDKYK